VYQAWLHGRVPSDEDLVDMGTSDLISLKKLKIIFFFKKSEEKI
jgi:hypothetical protein